MRTWKAVAASLLFLFFVLLTTCQMQFNNSSGNNFALRIVLPGNGSSGGKTLLAGARSLAGGDNLTVTITQEGTSFSAQQTASLTGQTSVDFSFNLSSTGTYDVLAVMKDASGNTLAQSTSKFTVPMGNYPVVLTMMSPNLLNAVVADSTGVTYPFSPSFDPTTYTGYFVSLTSSPIAPYTLTLTTLDPGATITTMTDNGISDSHIGSTYTLSLPIYDNPVVIVVTGLDGTTRTYTMTIQAPWNG
jgi:hypothetical protein